MAFTSIIYEKSEHVAWITLNRPEVMNARNEKLRKELVEALINARDDDEIYVIVITGAGDKAFCAGADISEFTTLQPMDWIKKRYGWESDLKYIREIPKPVIAMVNGYAIGGGFELAMACDIVIASEDAVFAQRELRVGVIPGGGGTQVLPRIIGEKRAKELIFTGKSITAKEAYEIGIVNMVVPKKQLKEATEEFVKVLLKQSPVILQLAKIAINRSMETSLYAGLLSETDLFSLCFSTEDQKEGAKAFLERRKPHYKGR